MVSKIQIESKTTFLMIFGAHMNELFQSEDSHAH